MSVKFSKLLNALNRFIQSDFFIAFNAILVFLGWILGEWVAFLCVAVVINVLPLMLFKDTKHLLGILMMFSLMISSNRHNLSEYAPLLCLVGVLFAAIAINLLRFKRRGFKFINIKGFHFSLILLIIPAALAGVGSPYEHPLAVVTVLALVIVFVLGYSFMTVTNFDNPDRKQMPVYALKTLFAMGLIILAQMIVYFAKLGSFDEVVKHMIGKSVALGWAGPNNVAPTLAMCIPATFYFCIKRNRFTPFFVLIALIEYIALFTTGCRGAILFATLAMPAMILYVAIKSENKARFCISICLLFMAGVVLAALNGKVLVNILSTILNKGLNSSGRIEWLYPEAVETFKRWPIFGAGWDYRLGELAHDGYSPYWYHSTAFQIIANMGITGVIFFALFYFFRYRTFLADRKNPASVALLAGLAIFDLYGMIDTNFFGPTFFVMLLAMTFAVEIGLDDDKCVFFKSPFEPIRKLRSSKYPSQPYVRLERD